MARQISRCAFISALGKHSSASIGKDLGLDKLLNAAHKADFKTKKIPTATLKLCEDISKKSEVLQRIGLNIGGKFTLGLLEHGFDHLISNGSNLRTPTVTVQTCENYGNIANYHKTIFHCGKHNSISIRLRNQLRLPNITLTSKRLYDTECDDLTGKNRKNLLIKTGFQQKTYVFFKNTMFLTADDVFEIYSDAEIKLIEKRK